MSDFYTSMRALRHLHPTLERPWLSNESGVTRRPEKKTPVQLPTLPSKEEERVTVARKGSYQWEQPSSRRHLDRHPWHHHHPPGRKLGTEKKRWVGERIGHQLPLLCRVWVWVGWRGSKVRSAARCGTARRVSSRQVTTEHSFLSFFIFLCFSLLSFSGSRLGKRSIVEACGAGQTGWHGSWYFWIEGYYLIVLLILSIYTCVIVYAYYYCCCCFPLSLPEGDAGVVE